MNELKKSILITLSLAVVALGTLFFTNGVHQQQNNHPKNNSSIKGKFWRILG
ncbi:hypothetical protein [Bacillus sp. NPDC077027]|uniref:hypothetical protein n=1 Tax=Bacillus sp. NPDC077027 TaxID=3390548 RepID=UPI003D02F389